MHWMALYQFLAEQDFLFFTAFKPTPGCTQSYLQWVLGALSSGVKQRGEKLTSHLYLVLRSRMLALYFHSSICLLVLN
jgi:hypothetical protein